MEPQPMIIDENSLSDLLHINKLVLIGNGAEKASKVISNLNARFVPDIKPVAVDMLALSEKAFREQRFIDVAYSTPLYLKDFQATIPKKKIL